MINKDLSYYIAGLWEGDGHIITRSLKTKQYSFAIIFNKNNIALAKYLNSYIGYGFIRQKKRENAVVLIVTNQKGLIAVVNLINGKLRTPKIYKFNLLIDWLNLKNTNLNLIKFDVDSTELIKNYWFAGFCEADGCFDIRISSNKQKSRIAFRLRLDQRLYDPITKISYYDSMNRIAKTFESKLIKIDKNVNSYFHICCINRKSLDNIILYFSEFNLLGIKFLDYNLWLKAYNIYKSRMKITPELILDLKKIKYQMNSRRTDFYLPHFNK